MNEATIVDRRDDWYKRYILHFCTPAGIHTCFHGDEVTMVCMWGTSTCKIKDYVRRSVEKKRGTGQW